jgi:hypothetical protein
VLAQRGRDRMLVAEPPDGEVCAVEVHYARVEVILDQTDGEIRRPDIGPGAGPLHEFVDLRVVRRRLVSGSRPPHGSVIGNAGVSGAGRRGVSPRCGSRRSRRR